MSLNVLIPVISNSLHILKGPIMISPQAEMIGYSNSQS